MLSVLMAPPSVGSIIKKKGRTTDAAPANVNYSGCDIDASTSLGSNPNANASSTAKSITSDLEIFREKKFAEKLHALLSAPIYNSILRWNLKGDAFGIYDQAEFVDIIMSKHFQGAKFDSFTRRMRRWGFRRAESAEDKLRGLAIYKCKFFLRENPELCKNMCDDRQRKRRAGTNGSSSFPSTAERLEADVYSPSPNVKRLCNGQKEPVPIHYPEMKVPNSPDKRSRSIERPRKTTPLHYPMAYYPPEEHAPSSTSYWDSYGSHLSAFRRLSSPTIQTAGTLHQQPPLAAESSETVNYEVYAIGSFPSPHTSHHYPVPQEYVNRPRGGHISATDGIPARPLVNYRSSAVHSRQTNGVHPSNILDSHIGDATYPTSRFQDSREDATMWWQHQYSYVDKGLNHEEQEAEATHLGLSYKN